MCVCARRRFFFYVTQFFLIAGVMIARKRQIFYWIYRGKFSNFKDSKKNLELHFFDYYTVSFVLEL